MFDGVLGPPPCPPAEHKLRHVLQAVLDAARAVGLARARLPMFPPSPPWAISIPLLQAVLDAAKAEAKAKAEVERVAAAAAKAKAGAAEGDVAEGGAAEAGAAKAGAAKAGAAKAGAAKAEAAKAEAAKAGAAAPSKLRPPPPPSPPLPPPPPPPPPSPDGRRHSKGLVLSLAAQEVLQLYRDNAVLRRCARVCVVCVCWGAAVAAWWLPACMRARVRACVRVPVCVSLSRCQQGHMGPRTGAPSEAPLGQAPPGCALRRLGPQAPSFPQVCVLARRALNSFG